ncbi:MAG TPA: hypothetical protein VKA34_18475 [Balneolales bacterium]|nr:hypothetical protein [Balneolales bacterium]
MLYIKKTMNPNPIEIDEYKNYLLIFSQYENKKDKNITVKAIGTNHHFKEYIYLEKIQGGTNHTVESSFDSIKEAHDAIIQKIDQVRL